MDISCGLSTSFFLAHETQLLHSCGKKYLSGHSKDIKDAFPAPVGPTPVLFFKHTPIKQVACGLHYVFVVTLAKGEVYGWGDNTYRQLGYAPPPPKKKEPVNDFMRVPHKLAFFTDNEIKVE